MQQSGTKSAGSSRKSAGRIPLQRAKSALRLGVCRSLLPVVSPEAPCLPVGRFLWWNHSLAPFDDKRFLIAAAVTDVRRQRGMEDLDGLEIELGDAVE